MDHLAQVIVFDRFRNPQLFRFVIGATIGPKNQIHQRGKIRIVACITLFFHDASDAAPERQSKRAGDRGENEHSSECRLPKALERQ